MCTASNVFMEPVNSSKHLSFACLFAWPLHQAIPIVRIILSLSVVVVVFFYLFRSENCCDCCPKWVKTPLFPRENQVAFYFEFQYDDYGVFETSSVALPMYICKNEDFFLLDVISRVCPDVWRWHSCSDVEESTRCWIDDEQIFFLLNLSRTILYICIFGWRICYEIERLLKLFLWSH